MNWYIWSTFWFLLTVLTFHVVQFVNFVTNLKLSFIGLIKPENTVEVLVIFLTMMSGFLMHIMVLFGRLTAIYLKNMEKQFNFSSRVFATVRLMEDWKIPVETQKSVVEFYELFWEKRKSLKRMPKAFLFLPLSLQSEACVDRFWNALHHSYFFHETDLSFKRYITLKMECNYFSPGEYLLQCGEVKTSMVYIVTGVVQVSVDLVYNFHK